MGRRENASGPGSRAVVVDLVRSEGQISRAELTERTGLTQPAISNIVRRLLDDGVIRESGTRSDTGGKPRTMLTINARATVAFGVHVEGGRLVCVATDTRGGIFGRQLVQAPTGRGVSVPELADGIVRLYEQVRRGLGVEESVVAGLAVVGPGLFAPSWTSGVGAGPVGRSPDLRDAVAALVEVPVHLDLDAAAAAVGEYWSRGVARESTFGCVHLGAGVGVGILVAGSLLRGSSSNAGALGHVCVDPGGRECPCGARGCLQQYVGIPAVVTEALADPRVLAELDLPARDRKGDPDHVYDVLARAAVQGRPAARRHVEQASELLAQAVLELTNLIDLDHVILTGPLVAVAGSVYVRAVRVALAARAVARQAHGVRVELSSNPRDAAAVGAAALVLQNAIAPGHGPRLGVSPRTTGRV